MQLAQRVFLRERRPVRTLRDHRDECAAGADDPRRERGLLAREPVRIAAPVPVLVARAHDAGDAAEGGRGAKDPLADDRVLADELPLALVERAGLVEDLVRDGELAEVVQLGRPLELLELVAAEPQHRPTSAASDTDVGALRLELRLSDGERGEERRHRPLALPTP